MEPTETHIGIGLAGSRTHIALVILVTGKDIAITEIKQIEEDKIEVRGKMLAPSTFIFLAEIYDRNNNEIGFSMHDRVDFDKNTKNYSLKLDIKPSWDEKRWIRIYTTTA